MAEHHVDHRSGHRPHGPRGRPSEAAGGLGAEHSFSLQAIMEVQRSIGRLENAVDTLSKQVAQQQRSINWMTRVLFIAAGVLLVLVPIAAWVLNNRFEQILDMLAKGG